MPPNSSVSSARLDRFNVSIVASVLQKRVVTLWVHCATTSFVQTLVCINSTNSRYLVNGVLSHIWEDTIVQVIPSYKHSDLVHGSVDGWHATERVRQGNSWWLVRCAIFRTHYNYVSSVVAWNCFNTLTMQNANCFGISILVHAKWVRWYCF